MPKDTYWHFPQLGARVLLKPRQLFALLGIKSLQTPALHPAARYLGENSITQIFACKTVP